MRTYLLAFALTCSALPAFAACTVDDIQKKTTVLMTEAQAAATRNQEAAKAWALNMQSEVTKAASMTDPEEACKLMDRLIGEAQAIK